LQLAGSGLWVGDLEKLRNDRPSNGRRHSRRVPR
jgi:hypothetical protein